MCLTRVLELGYVISHALHDKPEIITIINLFISAVPETKRGKENAHGLSRSMWQSWDLNLRRGAPEWKASSWGYTLEGLFLQEVGPRGLLVRGSGAANLPAGVWWAVEESNGALRPWLNLYSPASSGLHGKLCRQRIFCGIVEFIHFHFGPQPQWLLYSSNFKI